jgi:dTDP-4-amino-4,6-dideoxygalactose transaminase
MSEFHAAVGLAELDSWLHKRASIQTVAELYRRGLAGSVPGQGLMVAPEVAGCYALLRCTDAIHAGRLRASLAAEGIETRSWYSRGLHDQSYFSGRAPDSVRVADGILAALVGLPMAPDLCKFSIDRIVAEILRTPAS